MSSFQPVSVIIVNHNAGDLLIDCVRIALEQAEQVIVIDNHSSDSSMEILASQFATEPRLLRHAVVKNLGFAAGCNLGLGFATQQHILFLNPDCILGEGSLKRLVEVLDSDVSVGMVGGLLTNLDGSEQGGGRRAVPTPWRSFVRAFGLSRFSKRWPNLFFDFYLHKQPLPKAPIEVEAISGACMLVSKAAIESVGRWDDRYFLHCEDLDWCMRFRIQGWKILFVPDAPVLHYQGHSSRSKPIFVEWHKHKGMIRFYRKFFKHQYPGGIMMLVNTGVLVRFGLVVLYHSVSRLRGNVQGAKGKGYAIRNENQRERRRHVLSRRNINLTSTSLHVPEKRLFSLERRRDLEGTRFKVQGAKKTADVSFTGLLGASSFVGGCAISFLVRDGHHVFAFSRKAFTNINKAGVTWVQLTTPSLAHADIPQISTWLSVAPIRALPQYFPMLEAAGVRRVVALSSTSRFTKVGSSDSGESITAAQLAEGEHALQHWAESKGVEWVILRPTLIYGLGQDKNINMISNFIQKFGFFPLLGNALGLRQPIHVEDVAGACLAAMLTPKAANHAYNISGAEKLPYKEMVSRVFIALKRKPRFVTIPLVMFKIAVICMRVIPRYRHSSSAMAERMNRDMVFDHTDASNDFGFSPRPFKLEARDVQP